LKRHLNAPDGLAPPVCATCRARKFYAAEAGSAAQEELSRNDEDLISNSKKNLPAENVDQLPDIVRPIYNLSESVAQESDTSDSTVLLKSSIEGESLETLTKNHLREDERSRRDVPEMSRDVLVVTDTSFPALKTDSEEEKVMLPEYDEEEEGCKAGPSQVSY